MKSCFAAASIALFILSSLVNAETVFRCTENGKTSFSATAIGPSCQPLDIKVYQPNPQEASRQQRELAEWSWQRDGEVQRSLDREAATRRQALKDRLDALKSTTKATESHASGGRSHHRRGSYKRSKAPSHQNAAAIFVSPTVSSAGSGR